MTSAVAVTVFVVGLIASIMVHEWGHFATARRFGMRADRFFLGFGPTLWSRRVGETEYGVKALPLGGFVRIAGMSSDDRRLSGVPEELARRIGAGDDPVEAFGELLDERGTPTHLRGQLVARYRRTLGAGDAATAGAPAGVDLAPVAAGADGSGTAGVEPGEGPDTIARTDRTDRTERTPDDDRGDVHAHDHEDVHAHDHNGVHAHDHDDVQSHDRDDVQAHDHDDVHSHDDVHAAATAAATVDPVLLAVELIHSEVVPSGRVGDLHHRLTRGDEGRFFHDRPAWQRAVVLASGSVLHFAQAAVLIFLGWLLVGPPVVAPVVSSFADVELDDGTVVPSAAEAAGLEISDRIVAIDDVVSEDYDQLRAAIQESPGRPVEVTVEREGVEEPLSFTITPSVVEDEDGELVGVLGFRGSPGNRPMSADEALYNTFVGDGSFPDLFVQTFGALGDVFGPEGLSGIVSQVAGEQERDSSGGVSLVGAADIAGEGTDAFGPLFLFGLLASVNVFVGIFNALPLPPLDGGHLAVLGVEEGVNARRRRKGERADYKVDPHTIASIALPVIVFVATVSLALVYLDLTSPVSLQ